MQILGKDARYSSKVGTKIEVRSNTVTCHPNSIQIYSVTSFVGADPYEAFAASLLYWQEVLAIIENDLHISLLKSRSQNVKFVKAGEYAEVGNELARKCELEGNKIRVYSEKDGSLWFLIDNSFNLREAETVHPQEAQRDMAEVVQPFFNNLRDKRPPLPSEQWELLAAINSTIEKHIHEQSASLSTILKIIEMQIPKTQTTDQSKKSENYENPDDHVIMMYG